VGKSDNRYIFWRRKVSPLKNVLSPHGSGIAAGRILRIFRFSIPGKVAEAARGKRLEYFIADHGKPENLPPETAEGVRNRAAVGRRSSIAKAPSWSSANTPRAGLSLALARDNCLPP